jgi:hypothetical protein
LIRENLFGNCALDNELREEPPSGPSLVSFSVSEERKGRVFRYVLDDVFSRDTYRRRPKKLRKRRDEGASPVPFPNLLLAVFPGCQNAAWASDFTYLRSRQRWLCILPT